MKKSITISWLTLLFSVVITNISLGQHFSTVWTGNPYNPMSIIVQDATIDGVNMEAGDEIAVFDIGDGGTSICVGTTVLTGTVTPGTPAIITASQDEAGGSIDGYTAGNTIVYKLWDSSTSTEITMVVPIYNPVFDIIYTSLGTAVVTSLAGSSAVETTASTITTCQGSVIDSIDVNNIIDVTEFSLILDYGTTNLSYTGYQNANNQLNSGTLTVTENSGEITIAWNSTTAANITSGTLIEFLFTASTVYSQATENLTWDLGNSYYINSNGDTLQDVFNNGVVTIDPIPVDAGPITGTTTVCQGTTGESYQVGAITNATSYVWDLVPATAGTINGTGTTITIDFSSTYSGSATLSVYGSNSCGDGTSSPLIISVIANPTVAAGSDATICEDITYSLSGTATDQQSVLWTTSGDGGFNDNTSLTAIYTPGSTDISTGSAILTLTAYAITPCTADASDDMTLTIQELPTANAGADATICEGSTYTLSGIATNQQSVLWTTAGDGSFSDATSLTATYTPGSSDIATGSAILTLTAIATTPCGTDASDNMTITINQSPTVNAGVDANICEDATYTLSGIATNQTSVYWTTAGDGSFNDATLLTATYTPGSNDITSGSVILTLTAYGISPCANTTDDIVLSIQGLPTANAGGDGVLCGNNYYTLSGSATNQTSVYWTTSGDGTFDDATSLTATYTMGANDLTNGTVDLTLTAYAITPCGTDSSDDMTINTTGFPTADAGTDDATCQDVGYTLSGSATNQQSILWTTSGDGTFDDPTILVATYTPGSNDISNGTVDLTLTVYGCGTDEASDDMTLTIQELPTADAGDDDTICENESYTLNGAATSYDHVYWSTSGDGVFDDTSILNANYTPGSGDITSGSVNLTLIAYSISPCITEISDEMILSITNFPTVSAGDDGETCENDSYLLSGSADNYVSVTWSTSGDGTFDDPTILEATYNPGANDTINGTVELTLTAVPNSPCTGDVSDIMILIINSYPDQPSLPDGPITVDLNTTQISEYTTEEVVNASSYSWYLYPAEAGTVEGTDIIGTVYWDISFTGLSAYIYVEAINDCGEVSSDTLGISVSPVGINNLNGSKPNITIAPNPSNGKFNILIDGAVDEIDLIIINSSSQIIYKHKLLNTIGKTTYSIDISSQPKGIYYLRFVTRNDISYGKVIAN